MSEFDFDNDSEFNIDEVHSILRYGVSYLAYLIGLDKGQLEVYVNHMAIDTVMLTGS